jgi:replicative DNA helicase
MLSNTKSISSILKTWNLPNGIPPFLRQSVVTNLPDLGLNFGLFYEGELVVVSSLPGLGKTAFLTWLALEISKQQPLLWIPCGTGAEYSTMRFLLSSSGKSFEWASDFTSDAFLDALLVLREHQLFISEGTDLDATSLEKVIKIQVEKTGARIIVIDDILNFANSRSFVSQDKFSSTWARKLKHLAEGLKVVIILSSQIEHKKESYFDLLELMPRHIKYVRFQAPEVDKIIGLSRLSYHGLEYDDEGNLIEDQLYLYMLRNKNGENGRRLLKISPRMSRFSYASP